MVHGLAAKIIIVILISVFFLIALLLITLSNPTPLFVCSEKK